MIYIHAENLGLKSDLVNTLPLTEACAKNFNWSIRLSNQPISVDKDTIVVQMPTSMANSLANWYFLKDVPTEAHPHLEHMLMQSAVAQSATERLYFSVDCLTNARIEKRSISELACMANECEDHVEYGFKNTLYILLDSKGFEKFCEVEA